MPDSSITLTFCFSLPLNSMISIGTQMSRPMPSGVSSVVRMKDFLRTRVVYSWLMTMPTFFQFMAFPSYFPVTSLMKMSFIRGMSSRYETMSAVRISSPSTSRELQPGATSSTARRAAFCSSSEKME